MHPDPISRPTPNSTKVTINFRAPPRQSSPANPAESAPEVQAELQPEQAVSSDLPQESFSEQREDAVPGKRKRTSSLPHTSESNQPRKKKKRTFEFDAPTEEQLEAIKVPELPEPTHPGQHKTHLQQLRAHWSCKNRDLNDGEQVWAQVHGYPSWPAQVVANETIKGGQNKSIEVVFFDDGRQRCVAPYTI